MKIKSLQVKAKLIRRSAGQNNVVKMKYRGL